MLRVNLAAAEDEAVIKHLEQVGPFALQTAVHRDRTADAAGAAGPRGSQAHQRDDIAGVGVESLGTAGMVTACARLDVTHVDDVAEQFALPRTAAAASRYGRRDRHRFAPCRRWSSARVGCRAATRSRGRSAVRREGAGRTRREWEAGSCRGVMAGKSRSPCSRRCANAALQSLDLGGGEHVQAIGAVVECGAVQAARSCTALMQLPRRSVARARRTRSATPTGPSKRKAARRMRWRNAPFMTLPPPPVWRAQERDAISVEKPRRAEIGKLRPLAAMYDLVRHRGSEEWRHRHAAVRDGDIVAIQPWHRSDR